ncbi:TolC family protein [Achromobacter sp. NPDC058515]|uniref:TolC family protein n=1 Tax=Achromobacter sp. NPDC058515 TaxID=3346533 RepID=UPI003655B469
MPQPASTAPLPAPAAPLPAPAAAPLPVPAVTPPPAALPLPAPVREAPAAVTIQLEAAPARADVVSMPKPSHAPVPTILLEPRPEPLPSAPPERPARVSPPAEPRGESVKTWHLPVSRAEFVQPSGTDLQIAGWPPEAPEAPESPPGIPVAVEEGVQASAASATAGQSRTASNPESSFLNAAAAAAEADPGVPTNNAPTRGGHFSQWLAEERDVDGQASAGAVPEPQIRNAISQALQQAVMRSPLLQQAQAEWAAAEEDVSEAKGQRWPQIDLGANSRAATLGGGSDTYASRQGVSLNMTTNVFDWGRVSKVIESRGQLATAASKKYLADLESLAFDVSSNIAEREKNVRIVRISQQYVDRMSTLMNMLNEIVMIDRGRASELTQARARLLEAEASRDAAAARMRDIEIQLRKLIGEKAVDLPDNRDWAMVPANMDALLVAVREHPSLLQAEAAAEAAELNAQALKAGQKPQLDWVVNKSTAKDSLGREQSWQTMVTISWPLFRGGSMRAAQSAASLRAVAERQRKAQQTMDLEYEIRTADENARTFLARADLYRSLTAETDRVRKAFFEQWYHLGRRTLLDVLIAESDHHNNRVNEVNSRYDGYLAILRGYNRAGRLGTWLQENGG